MRKRVLLLDDDANLARSTSRILSRDFDVDVYLQGEDALGALRQGKVYDGVVSDMDIGSMNGIEFYTEVIKICPELGKRFMFHTGSPNPPATDVPLLAKRVPAEELRDTVWSLLS